jgi:sugar phosphate isomerase/epimerase
MSQVPVSYLCTFPENEFCRRHIMRDLASAGAKHIVLTEYLLNDIIRNFAFADVLKKEVADAGLDFCDAHAPFGPKLDLSCPYPKLYRQMIACHKLVLELCAFMNIDTITIHVGNNHFEEARNYTADQLIGRIKNSLAELLPLAEEYGEHHLAIAGLVIGMLVMALTLVW